MEPNYMLNLPYTYTYSQQKLEESINQIHMQTEKMQYDLKKKLKLKMNLAIPLQVNTSQILIMMVFIIADLWI